MTELRIDGIAVELPSTFSIAVKRENPFFTKSGEYTYDIELPLAGSQNAQLYNFLHRFHTADEIKMNRRAVLTADNRVYLDGTEIITGWTDENVKIQLVSGNSELNYLADEKLLIADVQMRETVIDSTAPSTDYIFKTYPNIDYCLPFVLNSTGSLVNCWRLDRTVSPHRWVGAQSPSKYDFVPQPFLCAYIRELIKGLGYQLLKNDLEDTFIKYTFLVHSQPTFKWADMFPGMTVREFLEAIEKTFNVSLQIDFRKRTVAIKLNNRYFFEAPTAYVQNVVDTYECDSEDIEENSVTHTFKDFTLMYDFPSTSYYQNAQLSNYARQAAVERVLNTAAIGYTQFFEMVSTSPNKIYSIVNEIDPARQFGQIDVATHKEWVWKYVDFFREYSTGTGATVVKMPIFPAEIQRTTYISSGLPGDQFDWACCAVVAGDSVAKDSKDVNLDDILAMQQEQIGSSQLRIALYLPVTPPTVDGEQEPQAFTDITIPGLSHPVDVPNNQTPPLNLRPGSIQKEFYSGGYEIDIEHPIKITSYDVNLFDTSSIFVINNRRFLCRDIEYTISAHGRAGSWTGTFYRVKISDTEMYKRWILGDGRWRDAGVWLDDGRWLDEPTTQH